jgi:hypothetical protein
VLERELSRGMVKKEETNEGFMKPSPCMGEGCQALATQELRRGWVRVKAVGVIR